MASTRLPGPVGGERGEASDWQIRADDAWKDKDEPEEAKLCSVAMARCAAIRSSDLSQA